MKTLGFILSIVYFHTASTAACRLFKSQPGPWHLCESGPLLMRPSHSLGCSVLTSLEDGTQSNPAPKAPSRRDFMVATVLSPYEFHPISLDPGCFPCVGIWQLSWLYVISYLCQHGTWKLSCRHGISRPSRVNICPGQQAGTAVRMLLEFFCSQWSETHTTLCNKLMMWSFFWIIINININQGSASDLRGLQSSTKYMKYDPRDSLRSASILH